MAYHIHLVSDSTGETIEAVARACLAQFEEVGVKKHYWSLIRSERLMKMVLEGIQDNYGLVLYTFVDKDLRFMLETYCHEHEVPCISILRPVLRGLISLFGKQPAHNPGRQHTLDEKYFDRIDAMDFAIAQDDGHGEQKLADSDVIVIGVSRTSKTPTCMYLAGRGIRAANVPFVPGRAMPDFEDMTKPLIVGLTKDVDNLIAIRRNRLKMLKEDRETAYTDPEIVREELQEARRYFARLGCPVIDVSRRSIEETAAEIMMLLSRKKEVHEN
ncbi:MAG: kinase/pyrophosphorylase [Alphaproteobacteria bacterium]|nr:kinase/pyrophosphorylase [Alphaproteobacteria bacterium]